MKLTKSHIREKATQLLTRFRVLSCPVDVEDIATRMGIQVRRTPTSEDVSGFLLKRQNLPAVIGVNSLHHPNRQRFTIAHELGHHELHAFSEVHVDRFVMMLRNGVSGTGVDENEVAANHFAAELLMPVAFVEEEIGRLDVRDFSDDRAILQLAKKFQVSVQAMSNRLVFLGKVPQVE